MPSHFPPPPPLPRRTGPFRQVPPAVFPPILGLLGLGLAWRRGAAAFGVPSEIAELVLGAIALLFLFALCAYGVKLVLRPGVWIEDLRVLPGRTGVAALSMGIMLLAAAVVPYWQGGALALLVLGFTGHLATALAVLVALLARGDHMGPKTPALHLIFVGFIVAPAAAVPLGGWTNGIAVLVWYCVAATIVVSLPTLPPLVHGREPPPLRPLQAIHLAPPALVASAAFGLGQDSFGVVMLAWSSFVAVVLLLRIRWMTAAGFSGFWSAFTFPVAAYAAALLDAWQRFDAEFLRLGGGIVLVLATMVIPPIALRILRMWADGGLAAKTNAAVA